MSRAKIELDRLRVEDGDIILIKQKNPVPHTALIAFLDDLRAVDIKTNNHVLILPPDVQVSTLNEKDMNDAGWFRRKGN